MNNCLQRENSAFPTSQHVLVILFVKYKLLRRVRVRTCEKRITGKQPLQFAPFGSALSIRTVCSYRLSSVRNFVVATSLLGPWFKAVCAKHQMKRF